MQAGPDPPQKAPTPGSPGPETGEVDRIDGLRAWVAQIDRKVGTRFYALAAAAVLALAAGIVAIVLVLAVKDDSATNAGLDELREEVAAVERSASEAADEDLATLGDRVSEVESELQGLRSDGDRAEGEISVLQDDIAELRDDVRQLEQAPAASGDDTNADAP